jgi:uncharacterized protein (DUF1697 family)
MPSVVFLRGVNVGGHKAFRPSQLAERLGPLRVTSLGAAGTFIVRADADAARIRKQFAAQLDFEAQLMICTGRDLAKLVAADPFADGALPKADGQYITIVEKRPRALPRLPLWAPEGRDWQVGLVSIQGCFVASLTRRTGARLLYPNELVEKQLGVAATTRGWPTILKIQQALAKEAG